MSTLDPQQRARLLAGKLKALVEATAGPADRRSLAFPGGAALADDHATWVLVGTPGHPDTGVEPARALGPALAVARQAGSLERVNVVAEAAAGLLARRASQFASPPVVWRVDGRTLVPAEPEPLPVEPPLDPRLATFAGEIAAAGADPVVEHGRLVGEVEGLEVCRAEIVDGEARFTVGVGRFDREANELLGSLRGVNEARDDLQRVVDLVRLKRTVDPEPHPLKRWAAARGLRARLIREPVLVGADHLTPMASILEAPDLRTAWPAAAAGVDTDGAPLVVVASVGVDLDLVPAAADARLADGRSARLVLAVPARDEHPVTLDLAAALARPASVVAVDA